jgi:HEAT repeat protein
MAPVLSAGALAGLGDPAGLECSSEPLTSGNPLVRGVASRQLIHLVPLNGADAGSGRTVDAFGLIDRALADEEPGVADEALEALRHIDSPRARERLERVDRGS